MIRSLLDGCRLIVHADDFGISSSVNQGVAVAFERGILTSASIMSVGDAFPEAIRISRSLPLLDIGVHLTLVGESSILPASEISSLVDSHGKFSRSAGEFVSLYYRGRIDTRHVYRELEAQINAVLDNGLSVSHIDSHQHVHMLPGILKICVSLAHKYGIRAIRVPKEYPAIGGGRRGISLKRVMELFILNLYCVNGQRHLSDIYTTDRFVGFLYGGCMDVQHLLTYIDSLPIGSVTELMCHPAVKDESNDYMHWGYRKDVELQALTDVRVKDVIAEWNVELTSYRDLLS